MSKCVLSSIVCVCLFVLSFPSPCVAIDYWDPVTWWGHGNDDIPTVDFSQFPITVDRPTLESSNGLLGQVVVSNLDLSGRDLRGARIHLLYGTLQNVNFDGANLEGANFTETEIENCSFRGANLRYTILSLSQDCDVTDAVFEGSLYVWTTEQLQSTWNFKNKNFSNIVLPYRLFPDMEYDSSFDFTNSIFRIYGEDNTLRDKIKYDDFSYTRLPLLGRETYYRIGLFSDEVLDRFDMSRTAAQAFRTREFVQKNLHGLTIANMNFRGSDFSGFTFGFFENCTFLNANFENVGRVTIGNINSAFGFEPSSRPFGFRSCDVTKEQIEQTRFWKDRRWSMRGIILEDMNLDGWDFSNVDLSHASLRGSSLRGANFENAILCNTDFRTLPSHHESRSPMLTVEQLMQTKSWKEKSIVGCAFERVNFDNFDLSKFHFYETTFDNCSFSNANLTGARIGLEHRWYLTEEQFRSLSNFPKPRPPAQEE